MRVRKQVENNGEYQLIEVPRAVPQEVSVPKLFGQWSGTVALADMVVLFYLLGADQKQFDASKTAMFDVVEFAFIGKTVGDTLHAVREYSMDALTKLQVAELGSQYVNTLLLMNAVNEWVGAPLAGPISFEYISAMNMLFASLRENAFSEFRTYLALATDSSIAVSVFMNFLAPQIGIDIDSTARSIACFVTAGLGLANVALNVSGIAPPTFEVVGRAAHGVAEFGRSVGRGIYGLFHRAEPVVANAEISPYAVDSEQKITGP